MSRASTVLSGLTCSFDKKRDGDPTAIGSLLPRGTTRIQSYLDFEACVVTTTSPCRYNIITTTNITMSRGNREMCLAIDDLNGARRHVSNTRGQIDRASMKDGRQPRTWLAQPATFVATR
eukprot:766348-Hanusia_phi.AAC.3